MAIPSFAQLEVVVLSEQGVALSGPAVIDNAAKSYAVTVNDADLDRLGIVAVRLQYSAPGQETVTLTNIFGRGDQKIDVVMPKAQPCEVLYCWPVDYSTSCCGSRRCCGRWR
jgi:hypothetical protein